MVSFWVKNHEQHNTIEPLRAAYLGRGGAAPASYIHHSLRSVSPNQSPQKTPPPAPQFSPALSALHGSFLFFHRPPTMKTGLKLAASSALVASAASWTLDADPVPILVLTEAL